MWTLVFVLLGLQISLMKLFGLLYFCVTIELHYSTSVLWTSDSDFYCSFEMLIDLK